MHTLRILAALILLTPLAASARELSAEETAKLIAALKAARSDRPNVVATFREEQRRKMFREPIISEGRIWLKPPNQFKREIVGGTPSTMYYDGSDFWIYYPVFKRAEHYEPAKARPVDQMLKALVAGFDLSMLEANFAIEAEETGAGEYKLTLTPKKSSFRKLVDKLFLTIKNDEIVRSELVRRNDDRIIINLDNIKHPSLNDSIFKFERPEGTVVEEMAPKSTKED